MEWYLTLDINKRIQCKDCFILLCGVDFQLLGKLLTFKERINILYQKLQLEGFDI